MLSLLAVVLLSAEPEPMPPSPPPPPPPLTADPTPAPLPPVAGEGVRPGGYSTRSRSWLNTELRQLKVARPTLIPQILVLATAVAGGGVAVGLGLRQGEGATAVFVGVSIGCLVIATVAAVLLYFGLRERERYDEKISQVEAELQRDST